METFPKGWAVLLTHVVNEGNSFNWSDILAQQLRVHVAQAQVPPHGEQERFYMSTYLQNVIYAQQQFPCMN